MPWLLFEVKVGNFFFQYSDHFKNVFSICKGDWLKPQGACEHKISHAFRLVLWGWVDWGESDVLPRAPGSALCSCSPEWPQVENLPARRWWEGRQHPAPGVSAGLRWARLAGASGSGRLFSRGAERPTPLGQAGPACGRRESGGTVLAAEELEHILCDSVPGWCSAGAGAVAETGPWARAQNLPEKAVLAPSVSFSQQAGLRPF